MDLSTNFWCVGFSYSSLDNLTSICKHIHAALTYHLWNVCFPKYYMMMPVMMRMMTRIMITVIIIQITLLRVSYFFFDTTFYCFLFFYLPSTGHLTPTLLFILPPPLHCCAGWCSHLFIDLQVSAQLDFFLYCLVQIPHSVTPASPGCNANGIGTWTQNCVTLWKSSALICIMSC